MRYIKISVANDRKSKSTVETEFSQMPDLLCDCSLLFSSSFSWESQLVDHSNTALLLHPTDTQPPLGEAHLRTYSLRMHRPRRQSLRQWKIDSASSGQMDRIGC